MTISNSARTPKAPRWITTEAGEWAWQTDSTWRSGAGTAFSVGDRARLLREAEQKFRANQPAAVEAADVIAGV